MYAVLTFIALLSPLAASGVIALSRRALGEQVASIGIWAVAISTGTAFGVLFHVIHHGPLLVKPALSPEWLAPSLFMDRLAAVMWVLITTVSLVIHVYSRRYMQGDTGYVKFFSLISLLTFVLLALVTSGHLLWLFLWWHAVTWLLKTLLSFNESSPAAQRAGCTTLRVLGLGDAALLAGTLLIYAAFGTFDLPTVFSQLNQRPAPVLHIGTWWDVDVIRTVTLLLVLSIMTKSAQFPFHIWLPGTIEAPTPVSAMLHAGIVNAGGFLVNRLAPLYGLAPSTLYILFIVGGLTALLGASTMLSQPTVKRTLVYSTMGQMGYMVMECGLGAFALAVFHLCAHGLFKATLFLNAGAAIHKSRTEYKLPEQQTFQDIAGFALMPWVTGLSLTLVIPLLILLVAHGVVHAPLFEQQGAMIFLFFAWVTSAQAVFSLYKMTTVASWKLSVTMIATLTFIGLTYLWAGESFTHFLYPVPGQAAAFFEAAAWNEGLFEAFVALAALAVVGVWAFLYRQARGRALRVPPWLEQVRVGLYVALLNALYVEDLLLAISRSVCQRRGRTQGI